MVEHGARDPPRRRLGRDDDGVGIRFGVGLRLWGWSRKRRLRAGGLSSHQGEHGALGRRGRIWRAAALGLGQVGVGSGR